MPPPCGGGAARKQGQRFVCETCPQYLLLDDSVYDDPTIPGPPAMLRPAHPQDGGPAGPVGRPAQRRDQTVSTDHCSFTLEQKDAGRGTLPGSPAWRAARRWNRASCCIPTALPPGRSAWPPCAGVLSEKPAKLYGMFPGRACSGQGHTDIVVYDPQADHLLRAEDMTSLAGYTPYEGFPIPGRHPAGVAPGPPGSGGQLCPGQARQEYLPGQVQPVTNKRERALYEYSVCSVPALFWCALALIVCFFVRQGATGSGQCWTWCWGFLCVVGGVALYYLGMYNDAFTIRILAHPHHGTGSAWQWSCW